MPPKKTQAKKNTQKEETKLPNKLLLSLHKTSESIENYRLHSWRDFRNSFRWKTIITAGSSIKSLLRLKVKNPHIRSVKMDFISKIPSSITWRSILSKLVKIESKTPFLYLNIPLFQHAKSLRSCTLITTNQSIIPQPITNDIFFQHYFTKRLHQLSLNTKDHNFPI